MIRMYNNVNQLINEFNQELMKDTDEILSRIESQKKIQEKSQSGGLGYDYEVPTTEKIKDLIIHTKNSTEPLTDAAVQLDSMYTKLKDFRDVLVYNNSKMAELSRDILKKYEETDPIRISNKEYQTTINKLKQKLNRLKEYKKENDIQYYINHDETNEDFTVILNTLKTLIWDYNNISEKIKNKEIKSDDEVMTIINEQIKMDNDISRGIMEFLEIYGTMVDVVNSSKYKIDYDDKYEFVESSGSNTNKIIYKYDGKGNYEINLSNEDEYKIEVVVGNETNQRSLSAIQLNSVSHINEYISNMTKAIESMQYNINVDEVENSLMNINNFMNNVNIDMNKTIVGGQGQHDDDVNIKKKYDEIEMGLLSFSNNVSILSEKIKNLNEKISDYILGEEDLKYYLLFVAQSGLMRNVDKILIYRRISFKTVNNYKKIIDEIISKMSGLNQRTVINKTIIDDKKNIYIEYFRSYHWIMIHKMKNMLDFLTKIPEENKSKTIITNGATGPIHNDLNMFNHFKNILDKYENATKKP